MRSWLPRTTGSRHSLRWGASVVGALAIAAAVSAVGCSPKKHPLRPNVAPETSIFVSGPISIVNHRVHLYWFGTDVDGDVVAYRMRFVYPPPANQNPAWDTIYCARVRSCTDSLFTMFTGDSILISPRFEIAAIDDDGALDETPAQQRFLLSNMPPQVQITTPLGSSDTTYASVTMSWNVIDPDGGGPGLHYRVWLDGNEANYDSTYDRTFTAPSRLFLKNGTYVSGLRTLSIQAVDDGGSVGPASSVTWYVRAPAAILDAQNRGRVLVIDDVPALGQSNFTFDAFYQGALSQLPAGTFSVLRSQFNPNIFRGARDFAQTLRQFQAVLWYRGLETTTSPWLLAYQDSLWSYIQSGGRVYLDGLYLVQGLNTPGTLRTEVVTTFLGSRGFYLNFSGAVQDSTAGWSNSTTSVFRTSAYGDTTMRTVVGVPGIPGQTPGIRAFVVNDTTDVVLWAMDSQLVPANVGFEAPVGLVRDIGSGRLFLLSLPIRTAAPAAASKILNRILYGPARSLVNP
jgi:hypothetical protein